MNNHNSHPNQDDDLTAKDKMRQVVEPKIKAALVQRDALVAELTTEPVVGEPAEVAQQDPQRVTVVQVRKHPATFAYINAANASLKLIGYTEHGKRHAALVGHIAANVLRHLDHSAREIELAEIAGLLHDIGNCINREQHGQSSAILAKDILRELNMPISEIVTIMGAIGNHEEERGYTISNVAAALILADKSDVHRSRVQNTDPTTFDIHDRVNYAATRSFLRVNAEAKLITLELTIDTDMASVMDYFEIFLSRMVMCRRAAEFLGCRFQLKINESAVV
ncbi:MAG: HD domain-containing protein [Herpetosiphon sp.]|nr:HD domain-containing protein [Herpetosiphon sp.]